jgi:hypothetical protein
MKQYCLQRFLVLLFCAGLIVSCQESGRQQAPQPPQQEAEAPQAVPPAEAGERSVETPATQPEKVTPAEGEQAGTGSEQMIPLEIKLPKPMFVGTPTNISVTNLERPLGHPRPPFLAPQGTRNVASKKPVRSSDEQPIIGELTMVVDGDKEGSEGSFVELGPNQQYVMIDLNGRHTIYAIVVWHYHKQPVVYHDVIVQVADDRDFVSNVNTLFNNDTDNTSGRGVGRDKSYVETAEGKLIDAKGAQGRYVRLYSRGNTANDLNHYVEVEVYGKAIQ